MSPHSIGYLVGVGVSRSLSCMFCKFPLKHDGFLDLLYLMAGAWGDKHARVRRTRQTFKESVPPKTKKLPRKLCPLSVPTYFQDLRRDKINLQSPKHLIGFFLIFHTTISPHWNICCLWLLNESFIFLFYFFSCNHSFSVVLASFKISFFFLFKYIFLLQSYFFSPSSSRPLSFSFNISHSSCKMLSSFCNLFFFFELPFFLLLESIFCHSPSCFSCKVFKSSSFNFSFLFKKSFFWKICS